VYLVFRQPIVRQEVHRRRVIPQGQVPLAGDILDDSIELIDFIAYVGAIWNRTQNRETGITPICSDTRTMRSKSLRYSPAER
jgi:hypothetical protein